MSLSEHEKNYTPSEWCVRYNNSKELLDQFFEFCVEVTQQVRRSIKNELNIPYGPGKKAKYDIYGTNLPKDAPIYLFIHGGYWQEFSKDLAGFTVSSLVSKGIKVIVAGYDYCPSVTLTDIVAAIQKLVEKILKLASENGSKSVWIAGHSAGAHLAGSLLYDTAWLNCIENMGYLQLIKGFVLISGLYDLKPLLTTSFNNAIKLTETEIAKFSLAPIEGSHPRNTDAHIRNIKVLVTVGEHDSPIFVEESRRMTKQLICFVDNVEFLLMRGIDHFDIVEHLPKIDYALTKSILKNILFD